MQALNKRCLANYSAVTKRTERAIDGLHRIDRILRYKPKGQRTFRETLEITEHIAAELKLPKVRRAAVLAAVRCLPALLMTCT